MSLTQVKQKFGLTDRQADVFKLYNKKNKPSLSQAAAALGCSPPNVAQILKAIEAKGAISRTGKRNGVTINA